MSYRYFDADDVDFDQILETVEHTTAFCHEARELFLAAAIEGKPAELEHAEVVSRLELAYTYCSEALAYAAVNDVSEVENIDLHLEVLEESRQGFQHALESYL